MGLVLLPDTHLQCLVHHPGSPAQNKFRSSNFSLAGRSLIFRSTSKKKRSSLAIKEGRDVFRFFVSASRGDSSDTFTETVGDGEAFSSGSGEILESIREELAATRAALSEARARQEATEEERNRLIEELAEAEAKQHEYIATITHDKESAVAELEAAKSLFNHKLQETLDGKFAVESRLVLAKQDAVELAVQVEKLAEIAFQQATSHILEDAQLRVSAAETSAAEAAHHIEEQIRSASEASILSIVEQSKDTIDMVLAVAEKANDQAQKALSAFTEELHMIDEKVSLQSQNISLQNALSDLERQLLLQKNEIEMLKSELEVARARADAFEARACSSEEAFLNLQESTRRKSLQQEEEAKALLEKFKQHATKREEATTRAFKIKLESARSAVEAAKKTVHLKDEAYTRRCAALQRSLKTAEAAAKAWMRRAEIAESLLKEGRSPGEVDEEVDYLVNGGRIDLLTEDDSLKWKLLADGPRREIPEWMARRIRTIFPKFPPRKIDVSEALGASSISLDLPKPEEVWSIAQEKPKEGDALIKHVIEKDAIEKQRKALERALQRKTIKRQRIPEKMKLEPGTGTGREIVFQGFNWESWRRRWYLELAPKAADLSQSGITAVWLPPPTESVAPQGYMPSDLYNLNSAYGSEEELRHCIEEIHSQDLLALGDVVLNHRCAQKQNLLGTGQALVKQLSLQSPNGIWNIFGGKLAWGPEAIVRDDPNFQGRGNPSTGDIFHAAPNIDHSQEFVRKDIKEWMNWLRNDIGFDGWRLDFVRGFSGGYVKEYIEASSPAFAIGEYWDSLAYEGGNLSYNQDAHRQRIINWINATGGTSSAFDVTSKGILHSALHNQYWRLIDPQGKPTGVMGWWPSRAVTFLENHDTGSTQGHWPFPREKLTQGYAYILTHPGTPVVFYDHFYDFGLHDTITELIDVRSRAGVHCRSSVKIFHANNDGYVALVGDCLVMKLGHFDWNPSKENNLDGTWEKFMDRGSDYQVWLRQ